MTFTGIPLKIVNEYAKYCERFYLKKLKIINAPFFIGFLGKLISLV